MNKRKIKPSTNKNSTPQKMDSFLNAFIENSPDIIMQVDLSGAIQFINRLSSGYEMKKVLGTHWLSFIPKEHHERLNTTFQLALKKEQVVEFETMGAGNLAKLEWYSTRICPLREKDHTTGAVLISRNITGQKLIELERELLHKHEKLIQQEMEFQRLRLWGLFKQAPALMCIVKGPQFIYELANDEYLKFIGRRDIIGRSVLEAVPEMDRDLYHSLQSTYAHGKRYVAHDLLVTADWLGNGVVTENYFNILFEPVLDAEGKTASICVVAHDVTERKKLKKKLQVSEQLTLLGSIAAGVGHEINTPLACSLMYLEMAQEQLKEIKNLNDSDLAIDIQQKLTHVATGLSRVQSLVVDLKTFSRVEDKASEAFIDVHKSLETALNMASHEVRYRAKVTKDFQPIPLLKGNEIRLGQIFLNLIINAAHAIDKGSVDTNVIDISTSFKNDTIYIKISDTGSGIKPENIKRIFDPFFTTKPTGVGTGLGLPLCLEIMTSMNGEIKIESKLKKGTTVILSFPT